ncbi:MAG: DUF4350 domain-containing protein [Prosthecobacter sp.]|uniref:DUF4350 domain-containing protein n=1 Tax=Prosthecobacter sp. TaxID=1965333 RepID=UPI003BAF6FF3
MRHFIRGLLMLAGVLALCACGDGGGGHWEEVERVTGYKGKARVNPFLAAERLLNELGHKARAEKSLGKMPPHDAVMFVSGEGGLPEGRAKQLLRWTYSGGHLIYFLDGTRPYNDFETQFGEFISAMLLEEQKDPVMEQLGVGVQKRFPMEEVKDLLKSKAGEQESAKDGEVEKAWKEKANEVSRQEVSWNGRTYQLDLGGYQSLNLKRRLLPGEFSAGPKDDALALHLRHGMGMVTLLAHARPFRNHWLGDHDHARWLSALVGEHGSKEVLFVAASTGSFFGLLWQHGWMAVVTLAICLGFWLWQQMPRFGPLAEVELDSTRHFASHIGALGEFFWRMRRVALLVNSARDAVWERVRERLRSLDDGSWQMNDALALEISRRSGLPVKRVTDAFDVTPPNSAHQFVILMRDLQTIRRAL